MKNVEIVGLFCELIQVSLGKRDMLSRIPTAEEWDELFVMSQDHAITGVLLSALDGLSMVGQKPPMEVLFEWIGIGEQIKGQNDLLNKRCLDLQEDFSKAGFRSCVLKGQGNAQFYPCPLLRQSGDIDIWVEGKIKDIIAYLSTKCNPEKLTNAYHHTDFPLWDDVPVEVHWRPSWRLSPVHNLRLQRWFKEQAPYQFSYVDPSIGIHVPTWEFNVVYLLQHMYLHIFQEGLGLRQVMDYYYLLISEKRGETKDFESTLNHLGLWRFAGEMMYVLQEVFKLKEKYMIAPVNEIRGRSLLREILQSGNFGQADARNSSLHQKRGFAKSVEKMKRQFRFLKDYPSEVLGVPSQLYHVIWRKWKLWSF